MSKTLPGESTSDLLYQALHDGGFGFSTDTSDCEENDTRIRSVMFPRTATTHVAGMVYSCFTKIHPLSSLCFDVALFDPFSG